MEQMEMFEGIQSAPEKRTREERKDEVFEVVSSVRAGVTAAYVAKRLSISKPYAWQLLREMAQDGDVEWRAVEHWNGHQCHLYTSALPF